MVSFPTSGRMPGRLQFIKLKYVLREAITDLFQYYPSYLNCSNAHTVSIPFDFRKAFDLTDHNILANKVVSLDVSTPTKNWILVFLIDRKQCVTLRNSGISEWSDTRAGVSQGTKLGPWLHALLINDFRPPQKRCEVR